MDSRRTKFDSIRKSRLKIGTYKVTSLVANHILAELEIELNKIKWDII